MTILTVAVAGLAIATLRYQPTAPEERSIYSPTTTTTPPAQAPIAPLTPTSSAPPPTSSTFSPLRDTNPTELPNGGRRFGAVEP